MVVSGLPIRNGDEHVCQIARMSLKILDHVLQFTIPHMPDTPLQARIGLHSGLSLSMMMYYFIIISAHLCKLLFKNSTRFGTDVFLNLV